MAVTYNDARWLDQLEKLDDASDKVCIEAVGKSALQLLNDSVMQTPTVPIDEGTLRASGSVHVNGKLEATSPHGDGGTPNEGTDETSSGYGKGRKVFRATVGFNTPYAAVMHESEDYSPSEPGSGPKYLSAKAETNAKEYRKIMSEVIRRGVQRLL
jgi:hypothetical protein